MPSGIKVSLNVHRLMFSEETYRYEPPIVYDRVTKVFGAKYEVHY